MWSKPLSGRCTLVKETRYPCHRKLSGPKGWSEWVRKIAPHWTRFLDRPGQKWWLLLYDSTSLKIIILFLLLYDSTNTKTTGKTQISSFHLLAQRGGLVRRTVSNSAQYTEQSFRRRAFVFHRCVTKCLLSVSGCFVVCAIWVMLWTSSLLLEETVFLE